MLTMCYPPLARALHGQTQFLTRLRLFRAAVPSNAVHPLFALQHTILDRARVPNVLSIAECAIGPVGILMRTDGSSPSNLSLAARPGTPNQACNLVDVARSTSAGDMELSSSELLNLDDSFEGLATTKNALLRILSSSCPLFFGNPTSVLRKVHIAIRVHHGPQRPSWSSHVQHTIHCCETSYFRVVREVFMS